MSNNSPYNNELANKMENMPMPDINMAWADMEKRLTQKEDKKPVPFWLNGCAIFALVAVVLFGIGFWMYSSKNKTKPTNESATVIKKETNNTSNTENSIAINKIIKDEEKKSTEILSAEINKVESKTNNLNNNTATNNVTTTETNEPVADGRKKRYKSKARNRIKITNAVLEENIESENILKKNITKNTKSEENTFANKSPKVKKIKGKYNTKTKAPEVNIDEEHVIPTNENIENTAVKTKTTDINIVKKDTSKNENIITTKINSTPVIPTENINTTKKENVSKKTKSKLFFNAGIGMQQQLAINGQTNTPYNSLGRKGTLLDYIPSVYARIEKEKKWFVQIEGKYGAPQYNKEFVYAQTIKRDTGFLQNFVNTNSTTLKKSFYHQIPITFNYYVTPKWSIGAGLQWNKFTGALAEKELVRKNDNTQTQILLFKEQILDKADSNNVFSKQYSVALLETQYKWKRFTIGAKYSFGLSPYIIFTLPGGTEQKLTSKTALVFIKYELWSSKKRKR